MSPIAWEELFYVPVVDCPNRGGGACAFVHTCVQYETDDDGRIRVKEGSA